MKKNTADFLSCPACRKGLSPIYKTGSAGQMVKGVTCHACHKEFLYANEYIDFIPDISLTHSSKREELIRYLYARFYTFITNFMFLFCGGAEHARDEVISQLELKENAVVLETGMGAGENFLMMNRYAGNLRFFGIDIQHQMMAHCTRNVRRWEIEAELFRADAMELPFRDELFDVVFHLGAFNLFSDKKKALKEMIRVAKEGATLVIADETEKAGRLFNILTGSHEKIVPPIDLVPGEMLNRKMHIIWRGYGYLIKFSKPVQEVIEPVLIEMNSSVLK
jgi:ubiquinone/menaquinone biosynthesis C-methylase UbiE